MLNKSDKENFKTLCRAFKNGRVALLEVRRKSDGKVISALVAVGDDGECKVLTPFATMVEGNPFELFDPPNPEGGFFN